MGESAADWAILAPGQRTVPAILRVMGLHGEAQFQKYHRVLNRAMWSSSTLSRILLRLLIQAFVSPDATVIARQCLARRIPTIEQLRSKVLALLDHRSTKGIKIHWQFSLQAARSKLNSHSTHVNTANHQYKET